MTKFLCALTVAVALFAGAGTASACDPVVTFVPARQFVAVRQKAVVVRQAVPVAVAPVQSFTNVNVQNRGLFGGLFGRRSNVSFQQLNGGVGAPSFTNLNVR